MQNLIQRNITFYRLALVGLISLGLYFYSDVFIFIPLMLLPAIPGALFSPWREKYKDNPRASASLDWYDGVVWIWHGFPAKDEDLNWTLKPRQGLGDMGFGTNSTTIDTLAVYGAAAGLRDSYTALDGGDGKFETGNPGRALVAQAIVETPSVPVETRGGLRLAYDNAGLFEIAADASVDRLNYNGCKIFSTPAMEVIRHLAASMGERPIISGNEVVFASNLIFLFDFVALAGDGLSYTEGNSSKRLIVWRSQPRYSGKIQWQGSIAV